MMSTMFRPVSYGPCSRPGVTGVGQIAAGKLSRQNLSVLC